jgi:hypothetical protein
MKSQRIMLRALTENQDIPYLEALKEIDDDPNILEVFFVMLAQRKLNKFFNDNESKFFSLSKKLEYDPTNLIEQFNDSNIHNDHLYFSLMKAFSQEEEGKFLWSLKNKLK